MPDFDLDKDRYRVQTKRGNWVVRDKPWQFVYAGVMVAAALTFVWWNRSELSLALMLLLTGGACFLLGMAFAIWIRRFD